MTPVDGTTTYRIQLLEKKIEELESKVDRLLWALVTMSLTLAGSAVVFVITVTSVRK